LKNKLQRLFIDGMAYDGLLLEFDQFIKNDNDFFIIKF